MLNQIVDLMSVMFNNLQLSKMACSVRSRTWRVQEADKKCTFGPFFNNFALVELAHRE
jgi:hypothetical protein